VDRVALRFLVAEMPKAELHVHLDGALRVSTALRLARASRVEAPTTFAGMAAALAIPAAPSDVMTEAALLARFAVPVSLMQDADALRLLTSELVEAKAADRVRYLEIKWAPLLHTAGGLPVEDVLDAVCGAAADAGRAHGVTVRLVVVAVRSHPVDENVRLAQAAASFRRRGVTGFDLAGSEADDPDPIVQAAAFAAARDGGLRITLHAGDLPGSVSLVRRALELEPERIAHGVGAASDPDLCAELVRRGVTLDLCPTSNVQSGSVRSFATHPLAALWRSGVPVTISTDDPTISAVTLGEEYVAAVEVLGLTPAELWSINLHALDAAFAKPEVIAALRAEFDAWAADIPELAGA